MLPGAKVTAEIAAARGVKEGEACISPASHSAFSNPVEMMQFIARLRTLSGQPTGFKFCLGHPWEWFAIVKAMLVTGITPGYFHLSLVIAGADWRRWKFSDHMTFKGLLWSFPNTYVRREPRPRTFGCTDTDIQHDIAHDGAEAIVTRGHAS